MAEYKWEVKESKLILKTDTGEQIAEITGLNSTLTSTEKTYNTDELKNYGYIDFQEHTMNGSSLGTAGTITLKDAALAKGSSTATEAIKITLSKENGKTDYQTTPYYKLALDGAVDGTESGTKVLGGDEIPNYWKVENGTAGSDGIAVKNAEYYGTGTTEKWTLNAAGSAIDYTAQVDGAKLATITGLKGALSDTKLNGESSPITVTETSTNNYTFTLSKDALNNTSDASDGNTITLEDVSGDDKTFKLALGTGIAVFDSEAATSTPRIKSVTSGTATIVRDQSAGWKAGTGEEADKKFTYGKQSEKKLATVENLNEEVAAGSGTNAGKFGTTDAGEFTEALTVSGKVVTLNRNALKVLTSDAKITIKDGTTGSDGDTLAAFSGFTLALNSSEKDASNNPTFGFENVDKKWELSSTTATYKDAYKKEGWTLNSNAGDATANKQVSYTAQETAATLATITNLNDTTGVVVAEEIDGELTGRIGYETGTGTNKTFVNGITVDGTTIKLAKEVLTVTPDTPAGTDGEGNATQAVSNATTLMDNSNKGFTLAKADAATTPDPETVPSSFKLAEADDFSTSHNIKITGTSKEGWKVESGGLSISYTAEKEEALAEITNLNSAVVAGTGDDAGKFGTNIDGKFVEAITLGDDKNVTINEAALTVIEDVKDANGAVTTDNATTLELTGKGKEYKNADSNIDFFLKKGDDAEDPGTTPIDIKLANLKDGTAIKTDADGNSVTPKTLQVIGTMTKGWTLNSTETDEDKKNKKISYTAEKSDATAVVLAEITNLNPNVTSKDITTGSGANRVTVTKFGTGENANFKEGITLSGTTVTLKEEVLSNIGDIAEIGTSGEDGYQPAKTADANATTITKPETNTFGNDYTYRFALDANVTAPAANTNAITNIRLDNLTDVKEAPADENSAVVSKTIDVVGTLAAGWNINSEDSTTENRNTKVTYVKETHPILATINNLDKDIAVNTTANDPNEGKIGKTVDSTFKEAISLTDKTVTLYAVGLQADSVTLTPTVSSNFDTDYKLALGADVVQDGQKILTGADNLKISSVENGTATIQAKKAAHWDLTNDKTITYSAAGNDFVDVATVTGLNKSIKNNSSNDGFLTVGADGTTETAFTGISVAVNNADGDANEGNIEFKLGEGSLTDSDVTITPLQVEGNTTKEKFTLTLDSTINKYQIGNKFGMTGETVGFEPIYYWEKTAATTTAYLKADRAEGWTLATTGDDANTKVTYTAKATTGQIVATIKNLQKNLVAEDLTEDEYNTANLATDIKYGSITNKIAGIKLSDTNTSDDYKYDTITLDKGVLTTTAGTAGATTLTLGKELGSTTAANYKLALQTEGDDAKVPTTSETEESKKRGFTQVGTTTTYNKLTSTAFWTINNTGGGASDTIIYTAQKNGDVLFTLKGLNSKVTEDDIDLTDFDQTAGTGTIQLKAGALNNANVTLVPGKDASGKDLSQTLTLFHSEMLADAEDSVPLSTLSNAKWSLNSAGTTATYKADVATGYEISLDGKTVIYTSGGSKTIATVSGLKGGLAVSDDGSYIGVKDENDIISQGLTLEDTANVNDNTKANLGIHTNVITLTKDVLGTTNVSLAGTGIGANYTLDIASGVPTTTEKAASGTTPKGEAKSADGTPPPAADVWRVSGTTNTTATYKNVVPLYYTVNDGSRGITYHAEATTKTYATVTNLAKGLTVKDDGTAVVFTPEEGTAEDVVKIKNTSNTDKLIIQVGKDALAAKTIAVNNGGTDKYTFELMDGGQKPDAPERDDTAALTFSQTQDTTTKTTTGYLKGTLKEGYTLSADNASVVYSTKNTNHTFATITGLKYGLSSSDFNGTNAGIGFADAGTKKQIQLDAKMLGTTDVKLDANGIKDGYTLTGGTGVYTTQSDASNDKKKIWAVNASANTTYNYKEIIPAYYTRDKVNSGDSAGTMLKYNEEKDSTTLATITNLKSGLKISDDRASLAGVKIGKFTTDGEGTTTFTENDTTQTDGKVIQLSKDVLVTDATKSVVISGNGGYTLTVTDDLKTADKDPYWTVSDTTATRKYDTTAGFVVSSPDANGTGTTVKYQAAKSGNTATVVATITGLKKGLTVKSDGSIDGIKFGEMVDGDGGSKVFKEQAGGKVVQLSESVLDGKEVSITGTDYKLALENASDLAPKSGQWALKVNSDNSVTLMNSYQTAGYSPSGTNGAVTKITYTEGKAATGSDVAKITGLKSGLKAVDGAIEGIDIGNFIDDPDKVDASGEHLKKFQEDTGVSSNANAIIRLSAGVLNGKDVEIKLANGSDSTNYKLAIKTEKDSDTDAASTLVATPVYTKAWKVPSKGKATFTETTTAGYALDTTEANATSATKISYSDKKVVTTTLAGLNDSIKLVELDATNEDGLNPDGTKVKVAGIDKNNYVKFTASTASSGGSDPDTEEEVVKNEGTFTLGEKVLKKGNVTLTNDSTYGAYTLKLEDGVAAENYNDSPQWFKEKNSDTATYSVKTKPGYTVSTDGLKVNYSTKDTYTHYATLKGLNKDIEATADGQLAGVSFGAVEEKKDSTKNAAGQNVDVFTYTKQILLGYDALTSSDVTVEGETKDDVTSGDGTFTNTDFTNGYKAEYILALKESDTNPNADANNNIGSKKWYEAQYATPTWTFNKKQGTATLTGGKTASWEANKTTTTGTGSSAKTTTDNKTIYYTAGTNETLATVSGVNVVTKDGVNTVEGLELSTWSRNNETSGTGNNATVKEKGTGTINLTLDSLNQKDVTVVSSNKDNYTFTFELGGGDIAEPEQKENVWVSDGKGNATYQYTLTEGYTLDATNKTTLTYSPEKTTQLAKLTGLNSSKVKATDADGEATIEGIEVTTPHTDEEKDASGKVTTAAAKGTITLTDASILGKTVKITGDKYQLGLSDEVSTQIAGKQWYLSGTTATYKEYYTKGYNLNDAKTTATQATTEAAGNTVLTIKGLKKNLKIATVNEGITVSDDNTVAINDTVLGTTKVTLTNGTYIDTNDDNKEKSYEYQFATEGFTTPEVETPRWGFSKGVANLMQNTTKGFTLGSSDTTKELNDVLTYSAAKNVSIAKVKGLNTALKAFNETTYTDSSGNSVEGNVIGTTKTETISGKKTTVLDKAVITFDEDNKIISLSEKAFNKKEVSVSGDGGYKLAFGDMGSTNTYEDQVTKWVVSGTTGSFKQYKPLYYTLNEDQNKITYTKEDSPKDTVFAKVTNLKKNTELTAQQFVTDGSNLENPNYVVDGKDVGDVGHVLTLNADNLNKKNIALSGNAGYALALGNDVSKSTVKADSSATANSKGTAVLKGTRSAGYELAFGSKSVTYISKDKANQTVVTVTGLKKDARITPNEGVITLTGSDVNKKTITLTSNLGTTDYTLAYTEDATLKAPTVELHKKDDGTDDYWKVKGSTASIMGAVTEGGYIAAASGKAVTYIKETAKYSKPNKETGVISHKNVAIATIKGMTGTDVSTVDAESKIIKLSGSNLGSKVTVSGGAFSVEIDNKFNESSLTGSSAADNISVSGSGLTITGGKGDDHITDLGGGNTFVYANGAGNDVITGFNPSEDKLVVTKGTITVEHDVNDAIVKVGAGKIRLEGAYGKLDDKKTLTIYSKASATTGKDYFIPETPTMTNYAKDTSNVLLEDNNYSADAANLSSLVEPHAATYTPYDFDANSFSLTKEDKLTSAAVTYSGDTNKK